MMRPSLVNELSMTRIDSHQHFWRYDPIQYDWIDAQMGVLRRDFLPPDLRPLLDAQRIEQCIAVQARTVDEETDFLLALAAEYPWIMAVIGWVDLRADDLEQRLDRWSGARKLAGFRHILQAEVIPADGPDAAFCRGVAMLQKRELIYELLLRSPQLHAMAEFSRVHDSYWLVLDHLGKPNIHSGGYAEWRRDLKPIAALPHVVCKVSGMVTEAMDASPAKVAPFDGRVERASAAFDQTSVGAFNPADLTAYLDAALELFGPERLMFGSDWPVCLLAAPYAQVAEIVEQWAARLSVSERDALWGATARRIYGL
jgi:L-fuconolactonase